MLRLASWTSFFASKPPSSFLLLERIQAPRDLEHKFSLIHMNSALLVELSKLFRTKTCVFLLNRWISPINACICLKKQKIIIIEEKIMKKNLFEECIKNHCLKFLSIFYCIADVAKCWSIFSRGKNSFQKCSFSNNILFLRSVLLFRIGSSFEKTFNIMIQVRECKCFYDNKHVSFFKKKSRMARVKLTLQANNYTIYIKRQGTQLNRIANKKNLQFV